jgi:hypothetical protein
MRNAVALVLTAIFVPSAAAASSSCQPFTTTATPRQATPTVPGLISPRIMFGSSALMPTPGPSPSATQCAEAWNRRSPRLTLRWVVAHAPTGALVLAAMSYVGRGSSGSSGSATEASGPTCIITIYLADRMGLHASGPWKGGRVAAWEGSLVNVCIPRTNASVAPDGTIRLR